MSNRIRQLYELGQSIWCDHLSRRMIDGGELQRLIDLGVSGVTSNPTIFMKAVTGGTDYDERFNDLLSADLSTKEIYERLVLPDIADAADMLRPVYDRTGGVDGYVSLEVDPKLAYDTKGTLAEARRLFRALNRPNVLIKVPATEEGLPAVERLAAEGINVNVTLVFGIDVYERVARAYMNGVRAYGAAGGEPSMVASVASFFVSRVDTLIDGLLEQRAREGQNVDHLMGKAGIANAKLAYSRFEELFSPGGDFAGPAAAGGRVQRPLWASTSTKNHAYRDTMYVDALIAPQSVNTLPPSTIEAVLDHAITEVTVDEGLQDARRVLMEMSNLDIDMTAVTDQLRREGVELFSRSYESLLENLESKRETVRAAT